MKINTTTATVYSIPDHGLEPADKTEADKISVFQLPKIAWACAILFATNMLIAGAIAISPELKVDIYGSAVGDVVLAGAKPSPFVEPEPPARPVRAAVKMTPVVEFLPEVGAAMDMEIANMPVRSASLSIPRTADRMTTSPAAMPAVYREPAYASGSKVYEAIEKQMDFPRISASLVPRPTVPAPVAEREARPAVVN